MHVHSTILTPIRHRIRMIPSWIVQSILPRDAAGDETGNNAKRPQYQEDVIQISRFSFCSALKNPFFKRSINAC